ARYEDALLGADETDLDFVARQVPEPGEEVSVRRGVGDDEVGGPKGAAVDRPEQPAGRRPRPEALAIGDERVVEGDERVEHHGPWPGHAPSRCQIEVARVPNDQLVEVLARPPEEARFRQRQPGQRPRAGPPFVRASLPDGNV